MASIQLKDVQVVHKSSVQQVSDKFSKVELLVTETEGDYRQSYKVQAANKNLDKVANINVGDVVTIDANLNGKLFTNKQGEKVVYNSIDIWKIQVSGNIQPPQPKSGKVDLSGHNFDDDAPF